jgi:hypothetical protein
MYEGYRPCYPFIEGVESLPDVRGGVVWGIVIADRPPFQVKSGTGTPRYAMSVNLYSFFMEG